MPRRDRSEDLRRSRIRAETKIRPKGSQSVGLAQAATDAHHVNHCPSRRVDADRLSRSCFDWFHALFEGPRIEQERFHRREIDVRSPGTPRHRDLNRGRQFVG